jgi:hypothetical protein
MCILGENTAITHRRDTWIFTVLFPELLLAIHLSKIKRALFSGARRILGKQLDEKSSCFDNWTKNGVALHSF